MQVICSIVIYIISGIIAKNLHGNVQGNEWIKFTHCKYVHESVNNHKVKHIATASRIYSMAIPGNPILKKFFRKWSFPRCRCDLHFFTPNCKHLGEKVREANLIERFSLNYMIWFFNAVFRFQWVQTSIIVSSGERCLFYSSIFFSDCHTIHYRRCSIFYQLCVYSFSDIHRSFYWLFK